MCGVKKGTMPQLPPPISFPLLSFTEGLFSVCLFKAFSLRFINIRSPFRPVLTS